MSVTAPASAGSSLSTLQQQLKIEQKKSTDAESGVDSSTHNADQAFQQTDLAAIQLSRLHELALSLGQARPAKPTGRSDGDAVTAPASSTMDLYA